MIVVFILGLGCGIMLWEGFVRRPAPIPLPPAPKVIYVLGRRPGRERSVYWYDAHECVDCCIAPDPKPWREEFEEADRKVLDELTQIMETRGRW